MNTVKHYVPNIIKVQGPDELAVQTLNIFIADAQSSLQDHNTFYAAISGGHTPERFFTLLAEPDSANLIRWEKVHLFWVDERCVPPEAEASNYGLASHTFLEKVPIPAANVHRVSGESKDYCKAVAEYEQAIRKVFQLEGNQKPVFDLVVLGMGSDGHVASLMPNSEALFDMSDLAIPVYKMDGDYSRITLTVPVLQSAKKLLVMISGREKAEIVRDVFNSEPDEVKFPVHMLWPILDRVVWLIDEEAGRYIF